MDLQHKLSFLEEHGLGSVVKDEGMPYEGTIEQLKGLIWEQSPVGKVDLIYQALKFKLAEEVDKFWEGTNRFHSTAERNIDMDNLQGITIYIVWALKDPTIVADLLIT